jgi:hypothetical protein
MSSDNVSGADNQQGRPQSNCGTLRDCTPSTFPRGDETVRPSWRHGEGGRNDRPATETGGGNRVTKVAKFLVG